MSKKDNLQLLLRVLELHEGDLPDGTLTEGGAEELRAADEELMLRLIDAGFIPKATRNIDVWKNQQE